MPFFVKPIRASVTMVFVLVTVIGVGTGASPVFAMHSHAKHDVKQQVEALEEQWRTAQLAGDVATMDKMLSDDYIGISMTGQVNTKAQQLERVREHKLMLTQLELGDRKVKLIGSIAIVTSRAEVEGTNDGAVVKGTFRYTRVYQHLPNGLWKITSFEATRVPAPRDSLRSQASDGPKAANQQPSPQQTPNQSPK